MYYIFLCTIRSYLSILDLLSPDEVRRVAVPGVPHLARDPVVARLQHYAVFNVHVQGIFSYHLRDFYYFRFRTLDPLI